MALIDHNWIFLILKYEIFSNKPIMGFTKLNKHAIIYIYSYAPELTF